jgi:uncharacterized protein with PQ loop repeat
MEQAVLVFRQGAFSGDTVKFLANLSELSGYLSISFWLFAQIPQVIKNHADKSVEGFSLGFLLCWFGGDFLNLVSCLLNEAMMFQTLLSSYYCLIDCILASQYYFYTKMYHNPESRWYQPPKRRHGHSHGHNHINSPRTSLRDNLENYGPGYGSIDLNITSTCSIKSPRQHHHHHHHNHHHHSRSPQMHSMRRELLLTPKYKTSPQQRVRGMFGDRIPEMNVNGEGSDSKNKHKRATRGVGKTGFKKLVSTVLLTGMTKVHTLPIPGEGEGEGEIGVETIDSTISSNTRNNSVIYRMIQFFLTMNSLRLGKILAWMCTMLYLVSRIPQIYTNYKLQSTSGVSLKLIIFALAGNFFYSMSLLLCESSTVGGEVSREFWQSELSYFIGAMGTVVFDICVVGQWYMYDSGIGSGGALQKLHEHEQNELDNNDIDTQFEKKIKVNSPSITAPVDVKRAVNGSVLLSPSHRRKLSSFTPLSPMDFLLEERAPVCDDALLSPSSAVSTAEDELSL